MSHEKVMIEDYLSDSNVIMTEAGIMTLFIVSRHLLIYLLSDSLSIEFLIFCSFFVHSSSPIQIKIFGNFQRMFWWYTKFVDRWYSLRSKLIDTSHFKKPWNREKYYYLYLYQILANHPQANCYKLFFDLLPLIVKLRTTIITQDEISSRIDFANTQF